MATATVTERGERREARGERRKIWRTGATP